MSHPRLRHENAKLKCRKEVHNSTSTIVDYNKSSANCTFTVRLAAYDILPRQSDLSNTKCCLNHFTEKWLREPDLNQRPSGYEPDELPNCSIPRYIRCCFFTAFLVYHFYKGLSSNILYLTVIYEAYIKIYAFSA